VQQAHPLEFPLQLNTQPLLPLGVELVFVAADRLALLVKEPLPLGAFCGLQAVFL
jgi:hypothetical protein